MQGCCLFTRLGPVQRRRLRLGQTRKKMRYGVGLVRIKPFTRSFAYAFNHSWIPQPFFEYLL